MLADDVINYPKSAAFERLSAILRPGYIALAADVAQAQRFVLRRDAVFLIHTISNISMSRVAPAMALCRMPYSKIWIEFVYRDRDDWYATSGIRVNVIPDASSPSRLGFLLEQIDDAGNVMVCSLVWRHRHDLNTSEESIVIGGYSMEINSSPGIVPTAELRAEHLRAVQCPSEIERKFSLVDNYDDPKEEEAALELEARIKLVLCNYMRSVFNFATRYRPESLAKLQENAVFDCLQEWRFIFGLLTVLNSRNVINYSEPIIFDKLNKQRLKRNQPLLHDHREIRLALSLVQRNRLAGSNPADLQAHLVRGHWKIRRTGLFWWSPFVRGTGELLEKPYDVRV